MSNPSINRWGLNLFWYRFWYNDKKNSLIVNQDNFFNKLMLIYIHYGLLLPNNIFLNNYWFNISKKNNRSLIEDFSIKYFRIIEYKNKVLNEYKSYKIRNKLKNLYFSKIWILRYQNWLIINFYCFQPLSKKTNKNNIHKKSLDFYLPEKKQKKLTIYRTKFNFFFFLNNYFQQKIYYKF